MSETISRTNLNELSLEQRSEFKGFRPFCQLRSLRKCHFESGRKVTWQSLCVDLQKSMEISACRPLFWSLQSSPCVGYSVPLLFASVVKVSLWITESPLANKVRALGAWRICRILKRLNEIKINYFHSKGGFPGAFCSANEPPLSQRYRPPNWNQ